MLPVNYSATAIQREINKLKNELNKIKVDDDDGKLRVDNSATGTTLGSVVKKIEVFSEDGVSLGFIPVYSSIT